VKRSVVTLPPSLEHRLAEIERRQAEIGNRLAAQDEALTALLREAGGPR
jgi:hypothetical protein